jgi:hypothetical protein
MSSPIAEHPARQGTVTDPTCNRIRRESRGSRGRSGPGGLTEQLEITSAGDEFISFQTSYRFPHVMLTTSSRLRFLSREHVEELIARSGLVVRDVSGDWMLTIRGCTLTRNHLYRADRRVTASQFS